MTVRNSERNEWLAKDKKDQVKFSFEIYLLIIQ